MAKLITDNETLVRHMPNVMETIDGERTYYDRLAPYIDDAEAWLEEHITPLDILAGGEGAGFVAAYALELALPALDLVLTPNGFGIVSNSNIAPASRERVERLRQSLTSIRCNRLTALMERLRDNTAWRQSQQADRLAGSILQRLADTIPTGYADKTADRWEAFIALREAARAFESEVAARFISPELYRKICHQFEPGADMVACHLHSIVLDAVRTGRLDRWRLVQVVDYIRTRPDVYPLWHESATARLFEDHSFKNRKQDSGYFF